MCGLTGPANVMRSLPARGAWIEITLIATLTRHAASLPARGAWIEMGTTGSAAKAAGVAPRTGSVD